MNIDPIAIKVASHQAKLWSDGEKFIEKMLLEHIIRCIPR